MLKSLECGELSGDRLQDSLMGRRKFKLSMLHKNGRVQNSFFGSVSTPLQSNKTTSVIISHDCSSLELRGFL